MSQRIVVDSSVVVKWFVREEPESSAARLLLSRFEKGECELIVPDLLFYEVGNVFLMKWSDDLKRLQGAFLHLWELPWLITPLRKSLLVRVLEIATQFHLTFYDALFVGTAEQADALFVTADEKMARRTTPLPFVRELGSFLPE